MNSVILRLPRVVEITGVPKPTIYRWIRAGLFPKPVALGIRSVGWHSEEINKWIEGRPLTSNSHDKNK